MHDSFNIFLKLSSFNLLSGAVLGCQCTIAQEFRVCSQAKVISKLSIRDRFKSPGGLFRRLFRTIYLCLLSFAASGIQFRNANRYTCHVTTLHCSLQCTRASASTRQLLAYLTKSNSKWLLGVINENIQRLRALHVKNFAGHCMCGTIIMVIQTPLPDYLQKIIHSFVSKFDL